MWYSLGFNIVDKQGYLYYGLANDTYAHQVFLTVEELTSVGQMLCDGGPVVLNQDAGQSYS